jgi:hypothetical protein
MVEEDFDEDEIIGEDEEYSDYTRVERKYYTRLLSYDISPLDIYIMTCLKDGLNKKEIYKRVEAKYQFKNIKHEVDTRITKLKGKGTGENQVLISERTILIDPSKLYDHVNIVFIKVQLASFTGSPTTYNWKEISSMIMNLNKEFGNPIKIQFAVRGAGEYDFIAIVYTNDYDKFHGLKEKLVEQGIIEKFDSKPIEPQTGFYFNPISIPNLKEYEDFIEKNRLKLEKMHEEITLKKPK